MFNSWEGQQHALLAIQYKFIINNKTQLDLRLFVVRIGGPDVIDETKDRTSLGTNCSPALSAHAFCTHKYPRASRTRDFLNCFPTHAI